MTESLPGLSREKFVQAGVKSIRDGFGAALLDLGKESWNVVAVCADLEDSLRMNLFAEKYPDRFFEVGVAEQNLIGVSAGLAKEGLVAFAGSYAAFSPGRTHDQIRVSVCYSNHSVVVVGGHAGLTVGADGATHQALEDIAMMRVLPNMRVLVPSDFESTYFLTKEAAKANAPVYLRLSRVGTKDLIDRRRLHFGRAYQHRPGNDLTIISCGVMIDRALQVAFDLEEKRGVSVRVLNMHTIKPIDTDALLSAAVETGRIMTIEEHQKAGGLGSAIAEFLVEAHPTPLRIIGVEDTFGQSGDPNELLDLYGFSRLGLLEKAEEFLEKTGLKK